MAHKAASGGSALDGLLRKHRLVLRACFAHGETGDWCPDAITRHLVECDAMTPDAAKAAVDEAVRDGILDVEEPEQATILRFPRPLAA